jgi:hypothetical protein
VGEAILGEKTGCSDSLGARQALIFSRTFLESA